MKTMIQGDGQLVLPKNLRQRLGWAIGTVVVLEVSGGRLIGEKAMGSDLVGKWRGRGVLPKGLTVDGYLEKVRG
jgi:bifunctional DNA-binding transcriptional regulator/antitoxin component of YhaV-PrlF toxin-antitoxin module